MISSRLSSGSAFRQRSRQRTRCSTASGAGLRSRGPRPPRAPPPRLARRLFLPAALLGLETHAPGDAVGVGVEVAHLFAGLELAGDAVEGLVRQRFGRRGALPIETVEQLAPKPVEIG